MKRAPVVDSILELVGKTPIVRINNLAPEGAATLWAKCEHLNPAGSIKDRISLAMIEEAAASGKLKPGDWVVEPTSGNTGIGLALVCRRLGYKLVLTMPASMSLERRALLEAYGAEIVLTEPEEAMEGAVREALRIVEERGAFMPQQFENEANPRVHREKTAKEIVEAFGDELPDALVVAVGTGGTISGVGGALKALKPSIRVIAVEPASSPVLQGGEVGPSKIQGLNAGFVPKNYDASVVDDIRSVGDREAWDAKLELARREGLLVGISAGANLKIAIDVAKELGEGKSVLTFLPDTGERYFSLTEYFSE
ncbi:MAG: cysteine synthase A [Sandaracinaceae bacterium]|nr:cysteine synthase A [Sandaracinaceae bacterium]